MISFPITLRNYVSADYADVKQILEEGGLFDAVWDSEENLNRKSANDPDSLVVAESDGRVLGVIYTMCDFWGSFVFHLAVQKTHRRRGIGEALLREAEKRLKAKGMKEIALFADDGNESLKQWYAKRGYTITTTYRSIWKKLE